MKRLFGICIMLAGLLTVGQSLSYYCVFKNWTSSPSSCAGGVGSDCYVDSAQVYDSCQLTVCADCFPGSGPVLVMRKHYLCQASGGGVICDTSYTPQYTEYVVQTLTTCRTQMTC